jgi:glycosyltransferase involved in cell wall biosynthesis
VTLRVAVDARTLQEQPLGGVARSTLGHLRNLIDEIDVTLLTDARQPPIDAALSLGLPQVALRGMSRRGATWLQVAAPRQLRGFPGIFHCPFYGLPFRQPVPMVVTIHDLTFEQHHDWFSPSRGTALRVQARWAARTAARILTPSRFTRHEVIERYGVAPDRVVAASNLLDHHYAAPAPPRPLVLDRLGVGPRYVLAMDGAQRRGIDLLLAGWPAIRTRHPELALVIVGRDGAGLSDDVCGAGALTDDEWRGALGAAELLCYPTRHEGFGYPALEAAALGTPVVASPVGALPEVLGDAARWIGALDAAGVADAVLDVLDHEGLRDELAAAGPARAASIDGAAASRAVLQAYRDAAGE